MKKRILAIVLSVVILACGSTAFAQVDSASPAQESIVSELKAFCAKINATTKTDMRVDYVGNGSIEGSVDQIKAEILEFVKNQERSEVYANNRLNYSEDITNMEYDLPLGRAWTTVTRTKAAQGALRIRTTYQKNSNGYSVSRSSSATGLADVVFNQYYITRSWSSTLLDGGRTNFVECWGDYMLSNGVVYYNHRIYAEFYHAS